MNEEPAWDVRGAHRPVRQGERVGVARKTSMVVPGRSCRLGAS